MRPAQFNPQAPKQTVSLTINSDLYAQARKLGINSSQVAEQALASELSRRRAELVAAEIRQDLAACDTYAAQHGSFADMVREHYQPSESE